MFFPELDGDKATVKIETKVVKADAVLALRYTILDAEGKTAICAMPWEASSPR